MSLTSHIHNVFYNSNSHLCHLEIFQGKMILAPSYPVKPASSKLAKFPMIKTPTKILP